MTNVIAPERLPFVRASLDASSSTGSRAQTALVPTAAPTELPPISAPGGFDARAAVDESEGLAREANRTVSYLMRMLATSGSCGGTEKTTSEETLARRHQPVEEWPEYQAVRDLLADDARLTHLLAHDGEVEGGDGKGEEEGGAAQNREEMCGGTNGEEEEESEDESEEEVGAGKTRRKKRRHGKTHKSRMSELERRIEAIRTDPAKRAELKERIERYLQSKRVRGAAAAAARARARRSVVASQIGAGEVGLGASSTTGHGGVEDRRARIAERGRIRDERTARCAEARKRMSQQKLAKEVASIQREQEQMASRVANRARSMSRSSHSPAVSAAAPPVPDIVEELERTGEVVDNWRLLLNLSGALESLRQDVSAERAKREEAENRDKAAVVLQRWYRSVLRRRSARAWRKRMTIVLRALRRHVVRWRVQRKQKAASVVKEFLVEIVDVTKVMRAVRKFRFCVSRSQSLWDSYEQVRQAQIQLLHRQWAFYELRQPKEVIDKSAQTQQQSSVSNILWGRRRPVTRDSCPGTPKASCAGLRASITPGTPHVRGPTADGRRTPATPGIMRLSLTEDSQRKVPDDIKRDLLSRALTQKRKAYLAELRKYRRQCDVQREKEESGAAHVEAPSPPLFRVLLSDSEIASLAERGLALAQHEAAAAAECKPALVESDEGW